MIILCKCGCGLEVEESNSYIHGHNRRNIGSCVIPEGKWAMKHDKCASCGTIEIPHAAKGLCKVCYKKYFYEVSKHKIKWSRKYKYCIDCGRTDRPYHAHGRCMTCHVNNFNRAKGAVKRNIGAWSWYFDSCIKCGTTDKPHVKDGMCYDCYHEYKRVRNHSEELLEKCPVCNVDIFKLWQHISMKAKKCEEHRKYQKEIMEMYFNSDLGLDSIAEEINSSRHTITKQFITLFGKEKTQRRNQKVKSCLCSERANIGFNTKNRFGTVVYYDSKNNGRVRFRSKLELKYAMELDSKNIVWEYEKANFNYVDTEGKRRTYTPDFYLSETNEYIEIKGFDNGDTEYKAQCLRDNNIIITILR